MPVRSWNIDHSCFSISVLSSSVWPVRNTQFSAPVGAALPAVNPEPLGYERKTTRTKLSGTFITMVCIRVISFAIFAFLSSDTKPSSLIAVYNGIRVILLSRSLWRSTVDVFLQTPTSLNLHQISTCRGTGALHKRARVHGA